MASPLQDSGGTTGGPPSPTNSLGASASRHNPANTGSRSPVAAFASHSSTGGTPTTPSKHSLPARSDSPTNALTSPLSQRTTGVAANLPGRVSSPTFNRRGSPITTPQRPSSRSSIVTGGTATNAPARGGTPTQTVANSGASVASAEAALSSLQELIKSMPSAGTPTRERDQQSASIGASTTSMASASVDSPSLTKAGMTMPAANSNIAGTSASTTPAYLTSTLSIQQPRFRASSSGSTLNPNAGGFQPGALSSLGEVEHEVLITPMVSSFSPSVSGQQPPNASSNASSFSPSASTNPYLQYQHQQQQSVSSANSNTGNSNFSNVFGSPMQTPQHQVGAGHNYSSTNPQEWQNFHNVFNAGIGNASTAVHAPGSGGSGSQSGFTNEASPIGGSSVADMAAALQQQQNTSAMLAAMQGMNFGGAAAPVASDFGNNAALAAALGMTNNPMNMQAQLAMLQSLQQQQMGFPNTQQQALALQQQQVQLQALLAAQAQAAQLMAAQQQPGGTNSPASMPPRFGQSTSQPDLAALAGLGGGNPFMAEQIALQAQYETLRQQQQDLLQRFSEMQFQAAQLAQAQAQAQAVQGIASPLSQSVSLASVTGSPVANIGMSVGNAQTSSNGPSTPSRASASTAPAPAPASAVTAAHRRGASSSTANSGPMGQFGSMGQFALPTSGTTTASTLPKGHGRRHSVNVKTGAATSGSAAIAGNGISAFSFPTGASNPTQSGVNSFQAQIDSLNSGMGLGTTREVDEGEPMPNAAQRALGHGRRESRGSIGSLAGWGSNSNIVTQSSVPITQSSVTDLAQAQAQLQQLSQFRASAGHTRVPSFGIPQVQGTPNQQQRKSLFAPYLPAASIPPLLQTGKLVIGILRVNKRNRSDAYVATEVLDADVFICGSKDRNRALEGDVVAVELLDVDDVWGTKKEKEEKKRKKEENTSFDPRFQQQLRKQDKKKDDVEVEGQGMTLFEDEEVNDDQKPTYAGHVVAVVERQAGQLFAGTLGILRPSSAATKEKQDAERRERDGVDLRDNSQNRPKIIWFKPVDKRVPLVAIPADQAPDNFLDNPDKYTSTLFVACIKRWPITSLHPFGSLVEELGEIGNIEAETNALLKDCGFTDESFGENVAKCLPPTPWTIPQSEIDARKDFRQCRVFTIDPETAKDLDDALHINKLDDGTFEVGVHIADVSHFVKPNSALDREAKRRGTTVYMVQRASPMLPPTLSETLCSLQPGEERLTFSAVFKMTDDGRVLSNWFGKSVIKSAAKLAYSNAQVCIIGEPLPSHVVVHDDHDAEGIASDIKQLDSMARQMRERRFDNGALRIDNVKLSFTLDEDGRPIDCKVYERQDSHSLIEEFMLLANQAVATKIAAGLPDQALLRRHEAPIARRLEGFGKRAGRLGYEMDIDSAGSLMNSFNSLKKDDPAMVLRLLATKSMLQAKYICSGMYDIAEYAHYALNVPLYTHFTSPIRRFADVIVHRQLEAALTDNPEARFIIDSEAVSKIAQNCNNRKAAAKTCQEQSQHLHLCVLISDLTAKYGQVRRTATVVGVLDASFDVVVPDFGIEKRVHLDQLPLLNYLHDERTNTLQLYWEEGHDSVKALATTTSDPYLQRIKAQSEHHASHMGTSSKDVSAEQALFEDEEEDGQVREVNNKTTSLQIQKSLIREPVSKAGCEKTAAGQCSQTIKELSEVTVVVLADTSASPGVIRIVLCNPYAP